jgi:hypothetical protein
MKTEKEFPFWLFPLVSWVLAGYFIMVFHYRNGLPPKTPQNYWDWVYLGISIFFVIAPFSKRIKIGKYIEFESELKDLRENISEFKAETRQSLSLVSTTVNSIGNLQNIVNIGIPRLSEAAKEDAREIIGREITPNTQEIKQQIFFDDEDKIMPLARTRIRIEQLLRKILGKRVESKQAGEEEIRFLSARSLFKIFVLEYPKYKPLEETLLYVLQVCNAAVHGQTIPDSKASEALDLGANIIALLSKVAQESIS